MSDSISIGSDLCRALGLKNVKCFSIECSRDDAAMVHVTMYLTRAQEAAMVTAVQLYDLVPRNGTSPLTAGSTPVAPSLDKTYQTE